MVKKEVEKAKVNIVSITNKDIIYNIIFLEKYLNVKWNVKLIYNECDDKLIIYDIDEFKNTLYDKYYIPYEYIEKYKLLTFDDTYYLVMIQTIVRMIKDTESKDIWWDRGCIENLNDDTQDYLKSINISSNIIIYCTFISEKIWIYAIPEQNKLIINDNDKYECLNYYGSKIFNDQIEKLCKLILHQSGQCNNTLDIDAFKNYIKNGIDHDL